MLHQITKYKMLRFILTILLIGLFLSSCQTLLEPRIILWHSWEGNQAEVTSAALARFSEIFDTPIIASYIPADEMLDRYMSTASQGLGPDIFVASGENLRELADANLIEPLASDAITQSLYYTTSLATMTYQEKLYGVPLNMRPLAMYYNREMVSIPATTLSELLLQAEEGIGVAINSQFSQIVWGIQAFGGQLLDNEGQVILNQGAYTNWLNWLLNANANTQVYLSRDVTTLQRLFTDGEVAYYTGSASELTEIRTTMGANKVGVVPLPAGPNGASGPLIEVDALMFNSFSSQSSRDMALKLAQFLTNLEQSNTFMRDLDFVPTNRRVRVDLRTYPAIAGFIAQTRTAVALPHLPQVTYLLEQGDESLLRVIEGVIDSNTAADELTRRVNSEFGLATVENEETCDLDGEIMLWHSLNSIDVTYLNQLATTLNLRCPKFRLILNYVPTNSLVSAYIEVFDKNDAPDMILTSTSTLQSLVQAGAVTSIESDQMQTYSPISQATVSLGGRPYGIPLALISNVFYYNSDIVADTPVTTDELLVKRSAPFILSRNADQMLWTLTAYNGIAVSNDQIVPNLEQLTTWLQWLTRVKATDYITITSNKFLQTNRFEQGESAYYIGSNLELMDLSAALGDSLSVGVFPTGTSPFASPLVTSLALFTNPNSSHIDTATALSSVVTSTEQQETMVKTLEWIPTNTSAVESLNSDHTLSTIMSIMQTGVAINDNPSDVLSTISRAIDQIFTAGHAADVVAQELFDTLSTVEGSE